ncbi:MAG: glutamyl-tRNA reductase [Methanolobus sp.]|jgi:glutamyl-tRNA reductase|uniref:glutamyl-tRNA reductase n=1 Tax=unclassified Methanolobus TaxID=2629569 RepID=UPI0024AC71AE|nr:glutamyl-tRNA reductase [Methanolobus sp.]MDI3486098.1 glutamyl-tRNA reductase [Methanolobus sp.]MDK2831716.1 glutamyl-tRNA reductase [Methanolobus sp.]MDK2938942.1 glutamyl-tRNA reductase [Methanolobus sp.]
MTEITSMVITHSKATVEEIEEAWEGDIEKMLKDLHSLDLVCECAVLKTCNRVEIYVVSPKGSTVLFQFAKKMGLSSNIIDFFEHEESIMHLLRLACGLESMIIGEDQILGQIKDLYLVAKKLGTTGKMLDTAFSKAIQVGKRVRTETEINRGALSIASASVDLAEDTVGDLQNKMVLVIGTGEMGTLVTRALSHREIELMYIANRTYETAKDLADEMGGHAVHFDQIDENLSRADVVISATGAPHYVLKYEQIEKAMNFREKELLLIDIANPRDIDPSIDDIPHVTLYNIDNLRVINEKNLELRMEEAKKAQAIIDEEFELLIKQYKRQRADTLVSELYAQSYKLRVNEKDKAITKLGAYHTIGETEQQIIEDLTHSIINKMLAEPTKVIRYAAEIGDDELLESVARVFIANRSNIKDKSELLKCSPSAE